MSLFKELADNVALLLTLSLLYSFLARRRNSSPLETEIFTGLLFGIICVAVMMSPVHLFPGVVFDARSILLAMAGLFGGPVPAAIAVFMAGACRIWTGGVGTVAGLVIIVSMTGFGLIFRHRVNERPDKLSSLQFFIFGMLIHLADLLCLMLIPPLSFAVRIIGQMALPVMIILPVGVVLLGRLLADQESRIRGEEALRASEQRLHDILAYAPSIIYLKDTKFQYILANRRFYELFAPDMEDVRGKTDYDLFPAEIADVFNANDLKVMDSGLPLEVEETVPRPDGPHVYMSVKFPLRDAAGWIYACCGISTDITESRKMAEKQKELEGLLRQSQKMEALGTLAGGIAHDFNNILGAIIGYAELSANFLTEDHPIQPHLEQILHAGDRARMLVRQILSFSRQVEDERLPIYAGAIIRETLSLIRASIPTTIDIRKQIPADERMIFADPAQIHQVLMNLCTNSAHAMRKKGGVLDVRLETVQMDRTTSEIHPDLESGMYQRIIVSDTGCGMPKDIVDRIFDPFFTTKDVGEGTGMGLAVVHGIVKSHGGAITVYSEPDVGTTFTVYFPVIHTAVVDDDLAGAEPEIPPTGTERILVVDDEKPLADFSLKMLSRLGYQVTAMTSSPEALELFREQPDAFDLVVTDLTMPRLTGLELAAGMFRIRPDIPVILCTGFSARITEEEVMAAGIRRLLAKPVFVYKMARAIREVLDESRG